MLNLKFNSANYQRILFCSDFHGYHGRNFIFEPRGFKSSEEHTEFIRREIQALHPEDLVFFLGDFALNATVEQVDGLLNMFPCETYMLAGNHNSGIKQAYDKAFSVLNLPKFIKEAYPIKIANNVTHLGECFELDIDRHRFYCRHFPALSWDHASKGRDHLCGHEHSQIKELNPGFDGLGKILDVGVENAIKYNGSAFFTLEQVVEILAKKKVKKWGHH